jgi:RNA polymerase sigma-70 factor (ECF subfamily)
VGEVLLSQKPDEKAKAEQVLSNALGNDADLDDDLDLIVAEACDGSHQAFRRLVESNQDKLFASMLRFLGCHAEAEEAVQEAFVRAFLRIDNFNRESEFSTWLYRIAFNAAITDRRKKRPKISLDQRRQDHGLDVADDDASDACDAMIRREQSEMVHRALNELSDDHRAILVLREMDDMAYEEIAKLQGISLGTVRSRLARARGKMKEAITVIQNNMIVQP